MTNDKPSNTQRSKPMNNHRIIAPDEQLRTVKHVDPNGRINIGRQFAFQSYSLYAVGDGRIVLTPIEFVKKTHMEAWRRAVRRGETPPPPDPLYHIPNEL